MTKENKAREAHKAYQKAVKVIKSSETREHLACVYLYIEKFRERFKEPDMCWALEMEASYAEQRIWSKPY